jgi:hypothetical protein
MRSNITELKMVCAEQKVLLHNMCEPGHQVDVVEVVHVWVETLAAQEQLDHMSDAVKLNTPKYLTLFLMWMNYPPVMDP